LDNGTSPGVGSFTIDLTPAAKASLSGSGTIALTIAPAQSIVNSEWTTEIIGPSVVTIAYEDNETTPATVRFRRAHWMPNDANDFEDQISWITASTSADSPIGSQEVTVAGVARGSYLQTVHDVMQGNPALQPWFDLYFGVLGGRNVNDLVRYMVPEQALVDWFAVSPSASTVALGHALGYRPDDLQSWQPTDIQGVYTLEAFGWPSTAAQDALVADYVERVRPVNDSFSFSTRNRVPVDYFLEQLSGLPAEWDFSAKDYAIAGRFHEDEAVRTLGQLGFAAEELLAELTADYNLRELNPVAPHAIETIARTHTNPTFRADAPLALIVVNRDFARGTFSEADIIGTIARTHRLVVAEAQNASELLAVAGTAHARHGNLDLVACVGHGSGTDAACLGIEDQAAFVELASMLSPGATVMLASCSGATYHPDLLQARLNNGGARAVHIAAAVQAAMPAARVVAATDIIQKSMITYDPAGTSPEERYRVAYVGSGVWGDISGRAAQGTPRDWLRREFGFGQDWDALEGTDSDGDGDDNATEYRAGTNPRSAEDVLRIELRAQEEDGAAVLRWPGTFRNGSTVPFRVLFTPDGGTPEVIAERVERAVRHKNVWQDSTRRASGSYSIEGFPLSSARWTVCE
jgi:hypothetical protein